jgi:hypothetical protein
MTDTLPPHEREAFEAWAREQWKDRSIPHVAWLGWQARAALPAAQPTCWGAFYFAGERAGKLYAHGNTEDEILAYIEQIHQSRDDVTLYAAPLYAAPVAAQPVTDGVGLVDGQTLSRHTPLKG